MEGWLQPALPANPRVSAWALDREGGPGRMDPLGTAALFYHDGVPEKGKRAAADAALASLPSRRRGQRQIRVVA